MSLDSFVELIFNVFEAHTVALFVKEEERLSCLSAVTFSKSFDKGRALSVDGTLAGWAVKHNEPLIIGNFDKDEDTLGYYGKKEEVKSFMAYPLDIPGVIVVDSKGKWVFTEKDKKIVAHFAAVLSKEAERERRLSQMEEEREEGSLLKRQIAFLRQPRAEDAIIEEVAGEALSVCAGDLAMVGVEKAGRLSVVCAVGTGAEGLLSADCPARGTIASTVLEGGREFLLPYDAGYLRERPLLFPNDGMKARQYFGFPLALAEKPFGFLGFVSLSGRHLREGAIRALSDGAVLLSLFLGRLRLVDEVEVRANSDPATGLPRFALFFDGLERMVKQKRRFSIVSVNLSGFGGYNRAFGPAYGDELLRRMRQGIECCMGGGALVTRSDGAHFYAAVSGSDGQEEGHNILAVLRFTILNSLSEMASGAKKEIEVGTAHFPRDGLNLWDLLDMADARGKGKGT